LAQAPDIKTPFMFVTLHSFTMVSVALLICSSLATPVSARNEAAAMARARMAVASSGEIHVVADDKMELMSEHLDLQNAHLEQMKTSVQFKNKLGGRCLSSNVDKYSRMLFEDCDASDGSTMWTNRGNNSYVATKSAAPLCPRVGAHVNCGRYSQNLGACAAGGSVCTNWYGSCTELGLKVFKVSKGLLLQTLGAKKHCLSIFTKGGEIDKGYKNLVVTTRGTTHFCGVWGSTWEMISTSEAIAAATAATAAAAAKAEAKAAAAAAAAETTIAADVGCHGVRCTPETTLTRDACEAFSKELAETNDRFVTFNELNDANRPKDCYANKKETGVYFNKHPTGQEGASAPSICRVAVDN